MAKTVTLLELRTRVRFEGDFENSIPIDDDRLNEVINSQIDTLWNLLLRYRGDAYAKEQSPAPTTTIGSEVVTLAADFYKLQQVEILDGGNYVRLKPHSPLDRGALSATSLTPRRLRYRFQAAAAGNGPVLRLVPQPTAVWTLRVTYMPSATELVADGDTFDGVAGFEDMVIALSVAKLKMRESMPSGEWQALVNKLTSDITADAGGIDDGTPFTLGTTERIDDEDDGIFGLWGF